MSTKCFDVIIIGGGIIGCGTAMQLQQQDPNLKIAILEKESHIAYHQTGHNSGVIHAGVYYPPGSLKIKFCQQGSKDTKLFCQQYNIPYRDTGKLIVAIHEHELPWLKNLSERCVQNGLTITPLTADEITKYQPEIKGLAGFWVKETSIVHWPTVCKKYLDLFLQSNGEIFFDEKVSAINESSQHVTITTNKHQYQCAKLICCAGLQADRLVKAAGLKPDFKIIPFRGEYFKMSEALGKKINTCVYPVPNPKLPFLGIHFTPQMVGGTTIGPNAILALSREGYRLNNFNMKDAIETLCYKGFWKMFGKQLKPTWHELLGSLSKLIYLKRAQAFLPTMTKEDLNFYPAGVRAQAMRNTGELIDDFLFVETDRMIHVCNAPSPAATSSLPIGKYIVDKFNQAT